MSLDSPSWRYAFMGFTEGLILDVKGVHPVTIAGGRLVRNRACATPEVFRRECRARDN